MSRYTNYVMKNNVFAELDTPLGSLATTIQLKSGQGDRWGSDFPILATLESIDSTGKVTKREIVKITGRSGDDLTVVRGAEACPASDDANSQGTTTFSFDIGDKINLYMPKEILDLINNGIKFLETKGTDRMRVLEAESGTALKIDIIPGNFRCADDNIVYAGATDVSVTDNATNYIMIDGTGTLQISTSDWDTRYTRLAKVTCASGAITNIEDRRLDTIGGNLGGLAIHTLTEKPTPVNTDELVIADSEDSYNNKRIAMDKVININGLTEKNSTDGNDLILIGDSTDSYNKKKIKVGDFIVPSISLSYWGGSGPYSNGIFANYNKEYFMFYSTSNRVEVYNKRGLFVVAVSNWQNSNGNLVMGDYVYSCESGGFKRILISNFLQMNFNSPEWVINTGSGLNLFLGFDGEYLIFMDSSRKIIRYDLNFNLVDNSFTAPNYTYHSMNFITAKHYIFQSSSSPYQMYIYDKTYNLIGTYQRDTSNMFYTVYNGIAYLFQKPTSSSYSKLWTPVIGL